VSGSARFWRPAVPLAGILLVALFAVLYRYFPPVYFGTLTAWGIVPFRIPFLDSEAVLSSVQCARQGIDVYRENPCDAILLPFGYSPLILEATIFPATIAWTKWTGLILVLAYFLCVASLPAPRGAREWIVMALAVLSTMSVFAVERGNIDLLIFLLMTVVGRLVQGRPPARLSAYAVILFAAVLKYYPVVVLIAALRERPRRFLSIVAVAAIVLVVFVTHYWHALGEAMTRVPTGPYFTDLFWAGNLPFGLAALVAPVADRWPAAAPIVRLLPWVLLAVLLLYGARTALATMGRASAPMARLPEATRLFMVIGLALIVGCFFAGQNVGYRGIFFLFPLPGLLTLGREPDQGQPFRVAAWLILFLMWGELFREALRHLAIGDPGAIWPNVEAVFWLTREAIWWWVIGGLAGLLLCFARETATGQWAESLAMRRVPR
jgi:hypothetical protein